MTEITPFAFDQQDVRAFADDEGNPHFIAVDLCAALDIGNSRQALARLDADEKGVITTDTLGGPQEMATVTESGMYALVLTSRKPEAKAFKRWITHEVIPAIRKTGSYGVRQLEGPELMARAVLEAAETIKALEAKAAEQSGRLALVEPKAAAFDRWLSANIDYGVGDAAKALCVAGAMTGRNRLFTFMAGRNWIFSQGGQWHPAQAQVENGRLRGQLGKQLNTRTGEEFQTVTIRITPKGIAALAKAYGVDGGVVADALDGEVAA